jgi:hypothetical protein
VTSTYKDQWKRPKKGGTATRRVVQVGKRVTSATARLERARGREKRVKTNLASDEVGGGVDDGLGTRGEGEEGDGDDGSEHG